MKTYYALLLIMCALAISAILSSPVFFVWKIILIMTALVAAWREKRSFIDQNIAFHNNKILVTENNRVYEANFQSSSVVARYLCFLHLQTPGGEKRWWIPVSRLEFSKETFRQLKCALQRFSMQTI